VLASRMNSTRLRRRQKTGGRERNEGEQRRELRRGSRRIDVELTGSVVLVGSVLLGERSHDSVGGIWSEKLFEAERCVW